MTQNFNTKILIIQTAFIGDVILATPVIEAINNNLENAKIDFALRAGNETLFNNHPHINNILVWDKKQNKYKNLLKLLLLIRSNKYNIVINLQRFASTGFLTALSGSKCKIGFSKNPFSFTFTHKIKHQWGNTTHETQRNLMLLMPLLGKTTAPVKLYPAQIHFLDTQKYKSQKYICAAPTSVWFTKQLPLKKWVDFFNIINPKLNVYLLGAKSDYKTCEQIIDKSINKNIVNLAGKLSFLESAALMRDSVMNYVNDSAPLHICSAVNAPTTAIFCSTIPAFGFGPLANNSTVIEITEKLACRPCGMHGKKQCPLGHFKCGYNINIEQMAKQIPEV